MTDNTIKFGTDGVRGHADHHPFTQESLQRLGLAIGGWATKKYLRPRPKMLLGHDTRLSCGRIKEQLFEGLKRFPLDIIDAGVLPTPSVCQLINNDESFDFGIVISASHNPYFDNGIKIFDARLCKITTQDEITITDNFAFGPIHFEGFDTPQARITPWQEAGHEYMKLITGYFSPHFLQGIRVVLDCAHGATAVLAPAILRHFGAEVITVAVEPNGYNINEQCGSTYPHHLHKHLLTHNAHVGFAFDGDGDRIVAVNCHGQLKDGDDILALLLQLSEFSAATGIVGTLMTNRGLEDMLVRAGKKLLRTKVGDKHVVAGLESYNLALGGEPSGHIILRDYLMSSEGILIALKVLESMVYHHNWEMKSFEKYPQVLINVPVRMKRDLTEKPCSQVIQEYEASLSEGRILVRYSGTENLLRVMTEALTEEKAKQVAYELAQRLQALLNE